MVICALNEIDLRLNEAKKKLWELFELKGRTDLEVLELGDEVDRLINARYQLTKEIAC